MEFFVVIAFAVATFVLSVLWAKEHMQVDALRRRLDVTERECLAAQSDAKSAQRLSRDFEAAMGRAHRELEARKADERLRVQVRNLVHEELDAFFAEDVGPEVRS